MFNRNKGFTMIELVVVMAIIAIMSAMLLPAIKKARANASVQKAKAEMASLASTGTEIKRETGYYVRLGDYDYLGICPSENVYVYEELTHPDGISKTYLESDDYKWSGPYHTYQPNSICSGTAGEITENAPLDPWNLPYWVVWCNARKAMVIYSAGPDKKFNTSILRIDVSGSAKQPHEYNSTFYPTDEASSSADDIEYRFRY